MTSVRDVYDFLDHFAPFDTQMDRDNSGLQSGGFAMPVESAMVCLDVTPGVIEQAAQARCQLIVAHHPVLFRARRQLLAHDPAWMLARHGLVCIASHTPLDACAGGVNDVLAEKLALGETAPLGPYTRKIILPEAVSAKALAGYVSQRLGAPVRFCDAGKPIQTIALCGGDGTHFLEEAYGVTDAYLTGDAGHHDFLDAMQNGLSLFAAGHYETEILVIPALAERLRAAFPSIKWHIADEYGAIKHA